jgi:glutaredoxin
LIAGLFWDLGSKTLWVVGSVLLGAPGSTPWRGCANPLKTCLRKAAKTFTLRPMARLVTARRSIVGRSVGIGMLALVLLLGALAKPTPIGASRAAEPSETVTIHVFWQSGCPYCSEAKDALAEAYGQDDRVTIRLLEIGRDRYVDELFERALGYFGFNQGGVPLVVIGDRALMGFSSGGRSLDAYAALVARCQRDGCRDVMSDLAGATSSQNASDEPLAGSPDGVVSVPQTISLPLVGVLDTQTLSLPVMTVLLAAIDGFNPCAMWVLVFLVGLLIGLESRRRRWALGGVFLAATAVMYFAVIAAWFNVVTFLGAASWLRYAIGALALWAGFYFLREYWTKPDAACRVTDPGQRQRIMGAFRATVANNSFVLAALGIAVSGGCGQSDRTGLLGRRAGGLHADPRPQRTLNGSILRLHRAVCLRVHARRFGHLRHSDDRAGGDRTDRALCSLFASGRRCCSHRPWCPAHPAARPAGLHLMRASACEIG